MAERRMFQKALLLSDSFLELSRGARALYLTLGMSADDDGMCAGVKSLVRQCDASKRELAELITSGYLIPFPSGVHAITHWHIHNAIRKDRHNPTIYTAEHAQLVLAPDRSYRLRRPSDTDCEPSANHPQATCEPADNHLQATCQSADNQTATQCQPSDNHLQATCQPSDNPDKVRLGKDRLGKVSVSQDAAGGEHTHTAVKRVYGSFGNVRLTDAEYAELAEKFSDLPDRIEKFSRTLAKYGYSYRSHKLALEDFNMDALAPPKTVSSATSNPSAFCASTFDTAEFFAAALEQSYGVPISEIMDS